jgi:hypothetical protein
MSQSSSTLVGHDAHLWTESGDDVYRSSGNVGIGAASPTSPLHVEKSVMGNSDYLAYLYNGDSGTTHHGLNVQIAASDAGSYGLRVSTGSNTNSLAVMGDGNVGIGTASPSSPLHVQGVASGVGLRIEDTGVTDGIYFYENGTALGVLGYGDDGNIVTGASANSMTLRATNALHFATNGNNLRATIDSSGNVGIGTSSPSRNLSVYGASQSNIALFTSGTGTTTSDGLQLITDGAAAYLEFRENGPMHFATNSSQRMTISAAGNVGIGTAAPLAKIDVLGSDSYLGMFRNTQGGIRLQTDSSLNHIVSRGAADSGYRDLEIRAAASGSGMTITTGGNVGIGGTPAAKLSVMGDNALRTVLQIKEEGAGDPSIWFTLDDSVGTPFAMGVDNSNSDSFVIAGSYDLNSNPRLTIDSSGKVGIGTTAPSKALHVVGGSGDAILVDNKITGAGSYLILDTASAGDLVVRTAGSHLMSVNSTGVGIGTDDPTNAKLVINHAGTSTPTDSIELLGTSITTGGGTGLFLKASNSTTASRFGARVHTVREATNNGATSLVFSTDDSSSLNEAMRIDSAGRVGIGGTPISDSKLDVSGAGTQRVYVRETGSTVSTKLLSTTSKGVIGTETNHNFEIATNDATRLIIDSSGKVGIGGTPVKPLHVFGDAGMSVQRSTDDSVFIINNVGDEWLLQSSFGSTGSYDPIVFKTSDAVRMRIEANGAIGIGGANYGTSGQVLTSGGSGAAPTWEDVSGGSSAWTTSGDDIYYNTGDVGIGTTSPTAKIEIVQTAATRGFQVIRNEDQANTEALAYFTDEHPSSTQATVRIRNDGTGDALQVMDGSSSALIVDGSGKVGMGTAAPSQQLDVREDHNGSTIIQATNEGTGASAQTQLRVKSNSALGLITIQDDGYTSSGLYQADALSIFAASTASGGLILGTEGDHDVSFYQNNASKMTLDGTGLGIGTSSPDKELHIHHASSAVIKISNDTTGQGATDGFLLGQAAAAGAIELWNFENSYTRFATNNAERMRIDNSGNVGIGTVAPSGTCHIVSSDSNTQLIVEGTGTNAHTRVNLKSQGTGSGIIQVQGTECLRIGARGQVQTTAKVITPSSSATVTYEVDMGGSNIQNLVCHEDNQDITINVTNMDAARAIKLHVDFSNVSSFSSLTVNWNTNQIYDDMAGGMVDGIGDDLIGAGTFYNYMVDLVAYGTSASDVYGSATQFS